MAIIRKLRSGVTNFGSGSGLQNGEIDSNQTQRVVWIHGGGVDNRPGILALDAHGDGDADLDPIAIWVGENMNGTHSIRYQEDPDTDTLDQNNSGVPVIISNNKNGDTGMLRMEHIKRTVTGINNEVGTPGTFFQAIGVIATVEGDGALPAAGEAAYCRAYIVDTKTIGIDCFDVDGIAATVATDVHILVMGN